MTVGRDAAICVYTTGGTYNLVLQRNNCHDDWINSVAINTDSTIFVTASNDFKLKVWRANLLANLLEFSVTLSGHMAAVNSVAFSPDGCTIISTSTDGSTKIWNLSGAEITTLGDKYRGNAITCTTESGELYLTMACADGCVRVYCPYIGSERQSFIGHAAGVVGVAMGENKLLVSCSSDGTIRFWDKSASGSLRQHNYAVTCVSFSTAERLCIAGDRGGYVSIWYPAPSNGGLICGQLKQLHSLAINDLACLPMSKNADDNIQLVTASSDGTVVVWLISCIPLVGSTSDPNPSLPQVRSKKFNVPVTCVAAASINDGTVIAGAWNGTVYIMAYDLQLIRSVNTGTIEWISDLCFSDSRIVSISLDGVMTCISNWVSKNEMQVDTHTSPHHRVGAVGTWLTSQICISSGVGVRDVTFMVGDSIGDVSLYSHSIYIARQRLHKGKINGMRWCSANSQLLTIGEDCAMKIWQFVEKGPGVAMDLVQLGEFVTRAPCLSIEVGVDNRTIVLGDTLGFVYHIVLP